MNVEEKIQSMTESVMRNSAIPKTNRTEFERYIEYLKEKHLKPASISLEIYSLKYFLELLGDKNVKKATRDDITKVVNKLNAVKSRWNSITSKESSKLSENTQQHIQSSIKRFYKHYLGNDEDFPRCVSWIKQKAIDNKLTKQDLLTEEEVVKIIEQCKNLRDRAIVSLCFEVGMRVGELLKIRRKDIDIYSQPAHITLFSSKTERSGKAWRVVGIVRSKPALIAYLEARRELQPDDIIWKGETWRTNKNLTADGVRSAVQRAVKAAGIQRRVWMHLFRHSSATINSKYMTEPQLRLYYGWSNKSTMPSNYVHLSHSDTDFAILKKNGMPIPEEKIESAFKIWICTVCQRENAVEAQFCVQCSSPRDVRVVVKYEEKLREVKEQMKLLQDINKLDNPEDVTKLIDGKTLEQIRIEREATEYFKEHQEEIMNDYVNKVVYEEQREAYGELTLADKQKFDEWSKKIKEAKK